MHNNSAAPDRPARVPVDPDAALAHLIAAAARTTAILRTCQFTSEHSDALDHAEVCRLLADRDEGINYDTGGQDVLSLARTVRTRLTAVEVYVSRLSEALITHTLRDPGAYPHGEWKEDSQ